MKTRERFDPSRLRRIQAATGTLLRDAADLARGKEARILHGRFKGRWGQVTRIEARPDGTLIARLAIGSEDGGRKFSSRPAYELDQLQFVDTR